MTTCPACRGPMTERTRNGQPRKFCSRACATRYATDARRAARIQDVTELLAAGETAPGIAYRLGLTSDALAHALKRAGRPDLASPFWAASWHEKRRAA